MRRRSSDVEKWWVATERAGEVQRTGHGREALDLTLSHLADRGDRACHVLLKVGDGLAGWTEHDLLAR